MKTSNLRALLEFPQAHPSVAPDPSQVIFTEEEDRAATLFAARVKTARQTPGLMLPFDDSDEKRRIRLARCGSFGWRVNPQTGQLFRIQYQCGLWRDGCPRCLEARVRETQKRMQVASAQCDSLSGIELDKDEADRFIRKLRYRNLDYARFPTEDSDTILFDYAAADELCSIEEAIHPDDLDAERLAETPAGRRTSGRLGLIDEDDEEETATIEVDQVYVEAGTKAVDECVEEAVRETSDLDPRTIEELQLACDIRLQAFKDVVLRSGGRITHVQQAWAKVPINCVIDWSGPG